MLEITPIPAFEDNYIWLLHRPGNPACAVVDPGDEDPVMERLETEGLELDAILVTHKHGDHVGGVGALKARWPGARVYGPVHEPVSGLDQRLSEGDQVVLEPLDAAFRIMEVPGHTEGHLAYSGEGVLFCGDTLFAGGCGRVFSGTYEQLSDSLRRIASLPSETLVYCAHEYTLANLGFAKWVEPDNQALLAREKMERERREHGAPTLPSTLALELATNPFLRTGEPTVIAAAEAWAGKPLHGHREVFRTLRQWKDRDYD
ncbi:MAG: hydroxyacylglutathione hydrolase [Gammaproteobacteria bacterium]|nr:MAG: hydroxyacylglutathione hydrolase [Gammaproteobacteria bacterium]RTZ75489.1 MAG: hydroxyacylglutathione hydrolase [Gammaproteobacteria bacterium]RTZ78659.1 MAG: hydroxyacylglutathione hydrolase [Gammaproteobacteria bacterium]